MNLLEYTLWELERVIAAYWFGWWSLPSPLCLLWVWRSENRVGCCLLHLAITYLWRSCRGLFLWHFLVEVPDAPAQLSADSFFYLLYGCGLRRNTVLCVVHGVDSLWFVNKCVMCLVFSLHIMVKAESRRASYRIWRNGRWLGKGESSLSDH